MLILESYGRFGNNVIQLLNALALALSSNTHSEIQFQFLPPFMKRTIQLRRPVYGEPKQKGTFFTSVSQVPYETLQVWAHQYILPCLKIQTFPALQTYTPQALVIHVRSGDIFSAMPHSSYIQPPLDYYRCVLQSHAWNFVHILYEDTQNPIVYQFASLFSELNSGKETPIPYKAESLPLDKTLHHLRYAPNIAGGYGTFAVMAALFAPKLLRLYLPDSMKEVPIVSCFYPGSEILKFVACPGYIPSNEWKNTTEQRSIMLKYKGCSMVV